jgi:putative membrane protein
VKKFGQMMIDDHTQAGHKLETVAAAQNVAVPTAIDEKHRDMHDKLAGLRGPAFDQEYASAMVDGHEDVLSKLESRIDGAVLADWKAKFGDALRSGAAETRQPPAVTPEKSDNPVTMAINQWAAEAYPTVFKHTESAKSLKEAMKRNQRSQ